MEAAAAAAMNFDTLSRRELQALCKRNGIRANMTNVAMAEALRGLDSVDGIDEIGTSLCLPTPGRSAMKSAAKVVAVEEPRHGSPLPRGRRVSVVSPEAIRMEVEGGEDQTKEIVKTPGVALRSTRRGTRATPAPLPTPLPACSTRATARRTAARKTVEVMPTPPTRRCQRMASRKAAGAVEADRPAEDVPEEKPSKMTMALDEEAEAVAAASKEEKVQEDEPKAAVSDMKCDDSKEEEEVQQEEPKAVASDVKCDDPEEEEVVKFLAGDNKQEELEEGEEADSSDAATGSAAALVKGCTDPKVEEVVVVLEEQPINPPEGIVKEREPVSAEKSSPLTVMEDSPILGVIEKEQEDAPVEDCEDLTEMSPAREMTDETIPVTEDKEVAINEDANAVETDPIPKEILLTAAGEDETIEEAEVILIEGKEDAAGEMPQAGETTEGDEEDYLTGLKEGAVGEVPQAELADNETSEEAGLTDVRERAAAKMLEGELADDETSEEDGLDDNETSEEEEDDLIEVREGAAAKMLQGKLTGDETSEEDDLDEDEWASDDDVNTEEMGSTDEIDEDTDETNEDSHNADAVQMLQGTGVAEDASTEDDGESDEDTDETNGDNHSADAVQMLQGTGVAEGASNEDDFSGDLSPEFDNIVICSDAETESDIASPVLEENQAVVASATKTVMSLDDFAMNAEQEEGSKNADATEKAMKEVDNVAKSLEEFSFKEGEPKEMQKQQLQDYNSMSLRKLKSTYKKCLIAEKEGKQEEVTEGKRLPLEEVDENACIDH